MKNDIYGTITAQIIKGLEAGEQPWQQPWKTGGSIRRPLRADGVPYSGINVLSLWLSAMARGYSNPTWMTYRKAAELGAIVRKGETGSHVVYASTFTAGEGDDERKVPFLKTYSAFNVEQIDGLPERFTRPVEPVLDESERIKRAERFFAATGARIAEDDRASYSPTLDVIHMPPFRMFKDAASYYGTGCHELIHWTGAPDRLNRDLTHRFGTSGYAAEELVAEIGAAFLCADLGISPQPKDNQKAYIAGWIKLLQRDTKAIFTASSMASKAAEYLHSLQPKAAVDLATDWKAAA